MTKLVHLGTQRSINVTQQINRLDRSHSVISVDAEENGGAVVHRGPKMLLPQMEAAPWTLFQHLDSAKDVLSGRISFSPTTPDTEGTLTVVI